MFIPNKNIFQILYNFTFNFDEGHSLQSLVSGLVSLNSSMGILAFSIKTIGLHGSTNQS